MTSLKRKSSVISDLQVYSTDSTDICMVSHNRNSLHVLTAILYKFKSLVFDRQPSRSLADVRPFLVAVANFDFHRFIARLVGGGHV